MSFCLPAAWEEARPRRAAWLGGEVSPICSLSAYCRHSQCVAMAVPRWGCLCQQSGEKCHSATTLRDAQLPWRCFWKKVERKWDRGGTRSREIARRVGAGAGAVDGGNRGGKPSRCMSCPWLAQSCRGQSGLVAAEAGVGLAGLQPSEGWTWIKLMEPHHV